MAEHGYPKGLVGGGSVLVQGWENTRGGEQRVSQGHVLVDQFGNPIATAASVANHVDSATVPVTGTVSKILNTVTAGHERMRCGIGHEVGDPLYLFFGAGTGKLKKDCYGPFFAGGVYEFWYAAVWQGEIWALADGTTATIHPLEITS